MNSFSSSTPAVGLIRRKPAIRGSFITAISAPLALTTHETFRRWMLALAIIDIPLQLDVNLAYNERYAAIGALGGFDVSLTTVAIFGLYVSIAVEWLTQPWEEVHVRCGRAALAYFAMCVLSISVARDFTLYAANLFLLLQMFLLYVYIASATRTLQQLRWIISMWFVGTLIEAAIFAVLAMLQHSIILPGFNARVDQAPVGIRIGGTVGGPNNASTYFAVSVILAIAFSLQRSDRRLRLLAMAAGVAGGISLVLTFSRGGWVALGLAAPILLTVVLRKHRRSIMLAIVLSFAVALSVVATSERVRDRIFKDDRGAAYGRIPLMKMAGEVIADHPLLGVGLNNYPVVLSRYARLGFAGVWLQTVHNKYLLVAAETGLLGLTAFLFLLWGGLSRSWRVWKWGEGGLKTMALAICFALVAMSIHMFVDIFRGRSLEQMFWVLVGLATAIYSINQQIMKRQATVRRVANLRR
jgi:O-antigen ligase